MAARPNGAGYQLRQDHHRRRHGALSQCASIGELRTDRPHTPRDGRRGQGAAGRRLGGAERRAHGLVGHGRAGAHARRWEVDTTGGEAAGRLLEVNYEGTVVTAGGLSSKADGLHVAVPGALQAWLGKGSAKPADTVRPRDRGRERQ